MYFQNRALLCLLVVVSDAMAESQDDHSHHQQIEEIVVTAAMARSVAETQLPVSVISGAALEERVAGSLGETLKNEMGVHLSSFGAGVGLPVIRGQTGNRVKVLQGGVGILDAANLSPDHANSIDTMLAERIEIIRGPATLLYGNGAVGGVVNVINSRIPSVVTPFRLVLEQRYSAVNRQDSTTVQVKGSNDPISFYADAYWRRASLLDIPGAAIDTNLLLPTDDQDFIQEIAEVNSFGYLSNSEGRNEGGSLGMSFVADWGFAGFSVNQLRSNYGLPPGLHSDHDHGHDDEHDDEHGLEELGADDDHHEEELDEYIRLQMAQDRVDLKGANFRDGIIEEINARISFSDYQHVELEFDGDIGVPGTRFSNRGFEGRFTALHRVVKGWKGVLGLQFSDSKFSAIGEEAFIPASDIRETGLFLVENYDTEKFSAELGARWSYQQIDAGAQCRQGESGISLSASALVRMSDSWNMIIGANRSERLASIEEKLSNVDADICNRPVLDEALVEHAATGLVEVGDPSLSPEVSQNIEFAMRKHIGLVTGEINLYRNNIDNYIYLQNPTEAEEPALYLQHDAVFYGVEAEVSWELDIGGFTQGLQLFGDVTIGEFQDGTSLPRIPGKRLGAAWSMDAADWRMSLNLSRVLKQNRISAIEIATPGYVDLSFFADRHIHMGERSLQLFIRGSNLLDRDIRHHASLVKAYSPAAGRNVEFGMRLFLGEN